MSTKKDNFTSKDKQFMQIALNLAIAREGLTGTNPSVGCVIVKNNSVISSGVTSINGRPHAEYNALSKNLNFKNAYMYVTLEPCTHHGITPPCTNLIKKKRIKKVYYCFEDPDIRTYKKAKIVLNNRIKKIKKILLELFFSLENKFEKKDKKLF